MRPLLCSALALGLWLCPLPALAKDAGAQDPVETFNRATFQLNERVDRWLLEPAAKGWTFITPRALRNSLDKFFLNLAFPVRFVSTLLQARPIDTGEETGRFIVNTTVGFLGFFDPATSLGLDLHREDFGQTLAVWGIPEGPYLMMPFYGPTTGRDAFGFLIDAALSQANYAGPLEVLNARAGVLDDVRLAREASLDFYAFARSAYLDSRKSLIADDGTPQEESPDDLYDDLYDLDDE